MPTSAPFIRVHFRQHAKTMLIVMVLLSLTAPLLNIVPLASAQQPGFQRFSTADGRYDIDYPESPWVAVEDSPHLVTIANTLAVYQFAQFPLSSGEFLLSVFFPETVDVIDYSRFDSLNTVESFYPPGAVARFTLEAREYLSVDNSDDEGDFMQFFFEMEGAGLTIVAAAAGRGEMPDYLDTIFDILVGIRLVGEPEPTVLPTFRDSDDPIATIDGVNIDDLPLLTQSFVSNNGRISVRAPGAFTVFDDGFVSLLPPGADTAGAVQSGDVVIYIINPSVVGDLGAYEIANTGVAAALQWTIYFRLSRPDIEPRNFSSAERFAIDGRDYTMFTLTTVFGDVAVIGMDLGANDPTVVYAVSASGELQARMPTIVSVATTVELVQ